MTAPHAAAPPGHPGDAPDDRARRQGAGRGSGTPALRGIVVVEAGLALGLVLLTLDRGLLPLAGVVLALALLAGLVRVRGELVATWPALALRHRWRRGHRHRGTPAGAGPLDLGALDAALGPLDVVDGRDHDGRPVALVGGEGGTWSAVLAPDRRELPPLLDPPGPGFPLEALAATLSDRGVVLDALVVVRHVRPPASPSVAREAHREVLGPLGDAARRAAWLVVRLDPARCPGAVAARGGGAIGARRALVGALARIGRVLGDHGVPARPLDREDLRDALALAAACDLDPGSSPTAPRAATVDRRFGTVVVGEVGHCGWAVSALPDDSGGAGGNGAAGPVLDLDDLVAPDAPTTVALALAPDDDGTHDSRPAATVAVTVRVSGRTPDEVAGAGRDLRARARAAGVRLDPLHGRQVEALVATLPLGAGRVPGAAP